MNPSRCESGSTAAGLWDATLTMDNLEIPFRFGISGTAPNLRGSGRLALACDQYASESRSLTIVIDVL